jgi:hypothetical protein
LIYGLLLFKEIVALMIENILVVGLPLGILVRRSASPNE